MFREDSSEWPSRAVLRVLSQKAPRPAGAGGVHGPIHVFLDEEPKKTEHITVNRPYLSFSLSLHLKII